MVGKKTSPQGVKYIGTSNVRLIKEREWTMIDVVQSDTQWDESNAFTILTSDLCAEALSYCIDEDEDFILVDVVEEAQEPDSGQMEFEV